MTTTDTASTPGDVSAREDKARRVLILANPTSGGYRPEALEEIRSILEANGVRVTLHLTTRAGEIGEIAASPNLMASVLAVAGGDGSVNEAVTGFQSNPNPPDLAVIPCGTANVLAHELGLPQKPAEIARAILNGKRAPLHAGLANGRPFVLMASMGFDAEVVHGVPLSLKRRLGKLAYVITALRLGFVRKSSDLQVEFDGRREQGKLVVATNGRCYGGPFTVHPDASVTRPGLYLLLLKRDDPLSTIRFGVALLMGRVYKAAGVVVCPFKRATVTSLRPVAAQVDGDPFGTTPIDLCASEANLSIIVP
ncbi:diacylglycerol/lipid kinase family protein [Roseibium litorale]|uniref:Diacylglycerol kinase family lipid kinase n=1 Tax=Roseibium litorale TaxID=2803841 RepID=A0ABR9CQ72_9HYPH|nr:diacylglycerol kinase family protein [Roseibium litorale]MBD8893011.1 diacylglycerol kinase family lipid kinase [Roseibium litorale]